MTDSPRQAGPPAPSLESELTCSICTELLHQPLTLLDCLHTYCGACLKEWFRFQAQRAESAAAAGPPRGPDAPVFTCPSCRERVRDTRHDPRVASLLDMFLALHPARARPDDDRADMDARYKRGDRVLPRLRRRSEAERRADEEERALIEEVRRVSLREATERAVSSGGAGAGAGAGSRGSREGSRVRGHERDGEGGGRRRARSAALRSADGGSSGGERRRRRSESRQTRPDLEQQQQQQQQQQEEAAARVRQVEHQSSLRSLISADGMDARDIEREIEEFARQIQEEGLLDGLDLDNLDLENNDELSRKITEAYRRRQRERRRDGGRRSNASAHSHRSDISARPRSRTDDASRPTSRQAAGSRAPSAGSNDERGRYPPSSSAHLEVQDPSRRRRTSSSGRSATLPAVPTQADVRVGGRAATDLTSRAAADPHARRPSISVDARSSSSPTAATAPAPRGDSPANRGLPFSARAAIAPPPSEARPGSGSSRQRSDRPPALDMRPESPTLGATAAPMSPSLVSPPLAPRWQPLPRYKEPLIHCSSCSREHIEYELHFNCALCHGGEWNICLDCWRRRKGCLHWLGFGAAAWARWERQNLTGPPTPPPHTLAAHRYLPPKTTPGGAEGRRVLTTENPLDRLQTGAFCCACAAWANDCYWRCDACNEGEWGFCNDCVHQGRACSHPLLPLTYRPPVASPPPPSTSSPAVSPPTACPAPWSPGTHNHDNTNNTTGATIPPTAPAKDPFHPVQITPSCAACRQPIPPPDSHFLCPVCPSPPPPPPPPGASTHTHTHTHDRDPPPGGYTLCAGCYKGMVADGTVAHENGPGGWRRCARGHRMVVVGYVPCSGPGGGAHTAHGAHGTPAGAGITAAAAGGAGAAAGTAAAAGGAAGGGGDARAGYTRRRVEHELVGGRRLRIEDWDGAGQGRWMVASWREEGGGRRLERLYSREAGETTATAAAAEGGRFADAFPPDGGTGYRAVAGWGWIPAAGVEDELMFPKGAEILEVEDVNGEWFHGYYMGAQGLFPAPYVRIVGSR